VPGGSLFVSEIGFACLAKESIGHPITSARAVRLRVYLVLTGACGYCISLPSLRLPLSLLPLPTVSASTSRDQPTYRADPWFLLDSRYPYSYCSHALRLLSPVQGMEMPRGAGPDANVPRFGYAGTGQATSHVKGKANFTDGRVHACRNPPSLPPP
jgi:hypothetical protein